MFSEQKMIFIFVLNLNLLKFNLEDMTVKFEQ